MGVGEDAAQRVQFHRARNDRQEQEEGGEDPQRAPQRETSPAHTIPQTGRSSRTMNDSRRTNLLPYTALGVGILSLGFSGIFVRWAHAPGVVTSFYRMAIAVALMALPFARRLRAAGGVPAAGPRAARPGGGPQFLPHAHRRRAQGAAVRPPPPRRRRDPRGGTAHRAARRALLRRRRRALGDRRRVGRGK